MMEFVDDKCHYMNTINKKENNIHINAMEIPVSTWYELLLFVGEELKTSKCC